MLDIDRRGNTEFEALPLALAEGCSLNNEFRRYALHNRLLSLIESDQFQSKPMWIAKTLGCSLEEVQNSIELLEELGRIEWHNGKIKSKSTKYDVHHIFDDKTSAKSDQLKKHLNWSTNFLSDDQLLSNHRLISHQILNFLEPQNGGYAVHTGFELSDKETIIEFYKRFNELKDWFQKESRENSKKDLLVGHTFTATNTIDKDALK